MILRCYQGQKRVLILYSTVKEYSNDKGLKLNVKNTKMVDIRGCQTSSKIEFNGEMVENVEQFEYLGATIMREGDCAKEVKRRLAKVDGFE